MKFASVTSVAVQLEFSSENSVFSKTSDIKIMTFPPALEMLGRYCIKVKTDKKVIIHGKARGLIDNYVSVTGSISMNYNNK